MVDTIKLGLEAVTYNGVSTVCLKQLISQIEKELMADCDFGLKQAAGLLPLVYLTFHVRSWVY